MLWVMIVSLPLQGMAAAIKLPCAMAHTPAVVSASAEPMDGCDDQEMAVPVVNPKALAHAGASPAQPNMPCDKDSHQHSCRTCPACQAAVVAPPPFVLPVLPVAHVAYDYIPPTSTFEGWIPSRIERPPRS
jgi:hypothetical protein